MSQTTLITFLGRVPKGENGYRTTRYQFADGGESEPVAFFGWPLAQRLRPERLVILGTSGSMWDHLFEGDFNLGAEAEEERIALAEAVERQQVGQPMLDPLQPLLSTRLACEVRLRIIPYCRNAAEQAELLSILAGEVEAGDRVHLDVTHGFRHLPMLALLSALHLRRVRSATIEQIWYGAFDPDTGRAPVHELAGMLEIADWLEALSAYERSGDYGVFADLIGGEIGPLLAEASFFESVQRFGQARSLLKKRVLPLLDATTNENPALLLFRGELRRRIGWAEGDNFYRRQRELALEYLSRGRYRDALLTGWEAFTTLLQRESGGRLDPDNHEHREQVRNRFDSEARKLRPRERWESFDTLRRLRNAVAHGAQPKGDDVQRALSSPQAIERLMSALFDKLLPEERDRA